LRLLGSESLPANVLISSTLESMLVKFAISYTSLLKVSVANPVLEMELRIILRGIGFVFKFLFTFFITGDPKVGSFTVAFTVEDDDDDELVVFEEELGLVAPFTIILKE
jgi:hypothetical protein